VLGGDLWETTPDEMRDALGLEWSSSFASLDALKPDCAAIRAMIREIEDRRRAVEGQR
jgi:hypothetical protein